jgi:nucleotide-binding universal stress UspA family protein
MAAVGPAIDIAQTYGARIHALSVVDTMAMGVDVRSTSVLEMLEESARSAVGRVEERASESAISEVETAITHGSPYRSIQKYVREEDIDLVVMGTHGRSGIERYLLGSVTEKTVRTASAPVMTVRRPE